MTAVKAGDVERVLRARPAGIGLLLFYGPDAGRVSERARTAAASAVPDASDPFQLVRLDGDDVADQPGKLVEEASTYGLFGEHRVVWVRATSRNIAASVSACLDALLPGILVVIEAGDLGRSAPLRALCEASPKALALPCYADETRDLATVVAESCRAQGFTIDAEARDLLVESLGGDRLASRGEIEKLVLYAHGRTRITADDVAAVVSDVSGLSIDAAIDAAFLGKSSDLEAGLRQLAQHGTAPGTILALAMRHGLSLASGRAALDGGQDLDTVMRSWRGLHFRRKEAVQRQVSRWPSSGLGRVVAALQTATLDSRRMPALAASITAATLFRIAEAAARRSAA